MTATGVLSVMESIKLTVNCTHASFTSDSHCMSHLLRPKKKNPKYRKGGASKDETRHWSFPKFHNTNDKQNLLRTFQFPSGTKYRDDRTTITGEVVLILGVSKPIGFALKPTLWQDFLFLWAPTIEQTRNQTDADVALVTARIVSSLRAPCFWSPCWTDRHFDGGKALEAECGWIFNVFDLGEQSYGMKEKR